MNTRGLEERLISASYVSIIITEENHSSKASILNLRLNLGAPSHFRVFTHFHKDLKNILGTGI